MTSPASGAPFAVHSRIFSRNAVSRSEDDFSSITNPATAGRRSSGKSQRSNRTPRPAQTGPLPTASVGVRRKARSSTGEFRPARICSEGATLEYREGADKTFSRLLSGASDAAFRFDELSSLLEHLGFEKRVKGSHFDLRRLDWIWPMTDNGGIKRERAYACQNIPPASRQYVEAATALAEIALREMPLRATVPAN
jgi:hypothetical protein